VSSLARPCGCASELPCRCGGLGASQAELREMRRAQEATMAYRATFLRYEPERDACSGQRVDGGYPEVQVCCGVSLVKRADPRPEAMTDGATVTLYTVRLPHWMAGKARPMSRYRIDQAHGRPLARPLVLEQVGDAGVGPTAVYVRARSV